MRWLSGSRSIVCLMVALGGCAEPDRDSLCASGASQACACTTGDVGAQRCSPEGDRWEECICESVSGQEGGADGSPGAGDDSAMVGMDGTAGAMPSTAGADSDDSPSMETGGVGATPGTEGQAVTGCGITFTLNPYPFGCDFAWGTNGNEGNSSSYLDFITTWVGYEYMQGREGDCDGCSLVSELASTDATAVYYAYFAGFALDDCNLNPDGQNLCTHGAAWIRENRDYYIGLYADYAAKTYAANRDRGVVWLLEGDYIQYTYSEQTDPLTMEELGQLAEDIVCAIRSNAPNAVVSINQSPWLTDDVTDAFWEAMPLDLIDFAWTTSVGNNSGFFNPDTNASSYNARTANYAYLSERTGKPVWADTSFGVTQQNDSWSGIGADELNARISEGVMAASATAPPADYEERLIALRPQLNATCP